MSDEQQSKDGAYYTPRHLAVLAVDQAFANSSDPFIGKPSFGRCLWFRNTPYHCLPTPNCFYLRLVRRASLASTNAQIC